MDELERVETVPTEEVKKQKEAIRKIAKENLRHLEAKCKSQVKYSRILYQEKAKMNHQVTTLKQKVATNNLEKEKIDLDRAILISKIYSLNTANQALKEENLQLSSSRQASQDIEQKLLINELEKLTEVRSLHVKYLESHNDLKEKLLAKKDELFTELLKNTIEERKKIAESFKVSGEKIEEEPLKQTMTLDDFEEKADLELITEIISKSSKTMTLQQLQNQHEISEYKAREASFTGEICALQDEVSTLKSQVENLRTENKKLRKGDYSAISVQPENMSLDEVKHLIGIIS